MNMEIVEEIVTDWHRIGHQSELPWTHLRRLIEYFRRFPNDTYVTYHLKTVLYFIDDTLQVQYWIIIRVLLDELCRSQSNAIIRAIQREFAVHLSDEQCIYYGHILVVSLGYEHRKTFINTCTEFPNFFLHNLIQLILFLYRKKHRGIEPHTVRKTSPTYQVLSSFDE